MCKLKYLLADAGRLRFLSGHALALGAPDGLSTAFAPSIANLLDRVTAFPLVRRAYKQEGTSDEIC